MYEYKFVRVDLEEILARKPKADHHRLVEEYAEKGWRLVQMFSPAVSARGGGIPNYFELIFERKGNNSANYLFLCINFETRQTIIRIAS